MCDPGRVQLWNVPGIEDVDLAVDLGVGDVTDAIPTADRVPHHRDGDHELLFDGPPSVPEPAELNLTDVPHQRLRWG